MDRLKRFLAIPMGASAVAALWLLDRQAGPKALVIGIVAVALLAAIFAVLGVMQRRGGGNPAFVSLAAVALTAVAIAVVPPAVRTTTTSVEGAEPWSEAKAASYVAQGHPVFVYFTADWCLTCKANEAAAIDRDEVREAFRKRGVKVLAGDWTNGDPAITRFLEAHGRAGVPFYLWYRPGHEPEELPQVLTPSALTSRALQP